MNGFVLKNPELKANIYYLTESEGGRKFAFHSGYRGQFYYDGKDWDAPQQFINKTTCELGETMSVYLQTLSPDFHIGKFTIGKTFEVREGAKTVGRGIITEILRDDFHYWDYSTFYSSLLPKCSIVSKKELRDFIFHFKHCLLLCNEIKTVDFIFDANLPNSMLTVSCKLRDKKIRFRPVIDNICEQLKYGGIPLANELHKINLDYKNDDHSNFSFDFAAWDKYYLTGKIIIQDLFY